MPPGLGRGEEGLRGGEVGKIERRVDLDVAEAQRRVDVVGVDAAGIRAVADDALVETRDAARGVRCLHLAVKCAADDLPGDAVDARDAADLALPCTIPVKLQQTMRP